jgi:hypothetical protein
MQVESGGAQKSRAEQNKVSAYLSFLLRVHPPELLQHKSKVVKHWLVNSGTRSSI